MVYMAFMVFIKCSGNVIESANDFWNHFSGIPDIFFIHAELPMSAEVNKFPSISSRNYLGQFNLAASNPFRIETVKIYPDIHEKLARVKIKISNPEVAWKEATIRCRLNLGIRPSSNLLLPKTYPMSLVTSDTTVELIYPIAIACNFGVNSVQFYMNFRSHFIAAGKCSTIQTSILVCVNLKLRVLSSK